MAVSDLSAMFKQVFGNGVVTAVPDFARIQKDVPFSAKERIGLYFEVPVVLEMEQGFTYFGYGANTPGSQTITGGASSLNPAISGVVQQAQVPGAIIILRSQLGYDQLARAASAGPTSFKDAMGAIYDNMVLSMARRLEINFILGQNQYGLGQVASITSHVITFTAGTFSPGTWSGMVGAQLDSFAIGATGATQDVWTTGTAGTGGLTVSAVNLAASQITVIGDSSTTTNSVLYFRGAQTYASSAATGFNEGAGLAKIITNTGTLFNISAATHALWAGQNYNVNGAISMASILSGVSLAVNAGLMEDAKIYISPKRWSSLNNDQAALRRYDSSGKEFSNGSEEICYYSSNGKISLVPHPVVFEGEAYLVPNPSKRLMRIGSCEPTFRRPGRPDDIFLEVPDAASVELRLMADQQIFIPLPAQCVRFYGITG